MPSTVTAREHQVLRLLALGHTNREVADLLHLSIRTAELHRAGVHRKLCAPTRAGLVRLALDNGVLRDDAAPNGDMVTRVTGRGDV